jgi:hypothetical protein
MQQRSFKYIGSRVLQVVALPVCLRPFFNLWLYLEKYTSAFGRTNLLKV